MTQVRKSITISAQQDAWLKAQVENGDYASDSEIIRDLIRREQRKSEADIDQMIEESMTVHAGTLKKLAQ